MARKIIVTESQLKNILESNILLESIFEVESLEEFKSELKKGIRKLMLMGVAVSSIIFMVNNFCEKHNISKDIANEVVKEVVQDNKQINKTNSDWKLASKGVTATVYNAVPAQCNKDCKHTASMFHLNLKDVSSHKIIAMERTFMHSLGLKFGDVVKLEGTDGYDGVWQVQDLMNKRFAGQKKIDILVPKNVKNGMWNNVKLYVLKDKSLTSKYKNEMADSLPEIKKTKK